MHKHINRWLKNKTAKINFAICGVWGMSLSILLSGCFLIPKEEEVLAPPLKEPPKIAYDYMELKKGVIERKIQCTGYYVSVRQQDLSFKNRSGRLKSVYVTIGDKVKKGDLLAEIYTDETESQIKQQEIMLEQAQMVYDAAVSSEESSFNIKNAELKVKLEKIRLDDLKRILAESRMISPIDGVVDYITDAKEGEYVDAYKKIVRVADPTDLQIQYTGDKVADFELGMKVGLKTGDVTYAGVIAATPSNMPRDADEKVRGSVRIKPDSFPKGVQMGDSADTTLMLAKKEDVIVIPKNLLHNDGVRKYVYILENGIRKERDVETGLESQTEVEITKGVSEGEKLIRD